MDVNPDKLNAFMGKMLGDIGAAANASLIQVGDRLGLYKALAAKGPMTPAELAQATGTTERYVREWLSAQAASGYVDYDAATGKFSMQPEQTMALADEDSPVFIGAIGDVVSAMILDEPKISEAFKTGKGVGWNERAECLFCGTARFFRAILQASSGAGVAARARWRGRQTQARRQGRRCRLRPRHLDAADGQGISELALLRLRRSSRLDRGRAQGGKGSRARRARVVSTSRPPRPFRPTAMTWFASSTACTTWAIRSAR